jgi:site-specific recombinase XerD
MDEESPPKPASSSSRRRRSLASSSPTTTPYIGLFLTKFRKGIDPRGIEKMVEKYLKEAGITNTSVHTLRHTFAIHTTIKKGTKLEVVRQALGGHESLETTSIYVHLAREMMDKELQENAL